MTPLLAALAPVSLLITLALGQGELVIRDTIGKVWTEEPIVWEIALDPGRCRDGPILLERDGRPIPSQLVVKERHGDGSVKSADALFIIDTLERNGSTRITAALGREGPGGGDLRIERGPGLVTLSSGKAAVRLPHGQDGGGPADARPTGFSPILGVRTPSGKWTGGGSYRTSTARPMASTTEVLERGPIRLSARVTTTFDNQRTHVLTVSLWTGSASIEVDERFDIGPEDKYRFKQYGSDRDELAWEWWSWYGDVEGKQEGHPNSWFFDLSSPQFAPRQVTYRGSASTDADRGDTAQPGESGYTLGFQKERQLEKYLAGHCQWRPDAVLWYGVSEGSAPEDDVVAVYTHSVRSWRNPSTLPVPRGLTLRTGVNDMRIWSEAEGKKLQVECPIGLGRRVWAIRCSTVGESYGQRGSSSTALTADRVQRCLGLDITRKWVTDWPVSRDYPRLFVNPEDRAGYYARFKDKGVGMPGHGIDRFLRHQDQDNFDYYYKEIESSADRMIEGYFSLGTDNTSQYPGWMLGYWHGIIVASGLDNLAGHPLCTPERATSLRKKLAILTYALTSKDAWPDKQINYGWGSMNMPVGRWGGLAVMASAISDHPLSKEWLQDTGRYYRMLLQTEWAPDGTHISCPHYIGAASTSFYAWIVMANSGQGQDVSRSPELERFARYYMQLMTPIDVRWGIRTLNTEGDTRPGSSSLPAILGTLFKRSNPDLSGQLLRMWIDGGKELSSGMGVPDALIIDESIPPVPLRLGPEVFPGFGAFLRYRELGTKEEAYLSFLGGDFMIDHTNADQLAFEWYEKGVPLTLYQGDMYVPGAVTALSHNTVCWEVRPPGPPTPGKDRPGDWYFDHQVPWVEHVNRPRLHLQVSWDRDKQKITDSRGKVTLATDSPGAALLEGRVPVTVLTEVPTLPDFSVAMVRQIPTPKVAIEKPFEWKRRLLYVKAQRADGMNYLVVRDDLDGFARFTPSFSYWSLARGVSLLERGAAFQGQLGVDTQLFVAVPERIKLFEDSFTHDQCEPIVGHLQPGFKETQVCARVEGQRGEGFLYVVFPRKAGEAAAAIEAWQGGRGVKVSWKGQTHYVLLDIREQEVAADGIAARASCAVVKVTDARNFSIGLPAGGEARYGGKELKSDGPAELTVVDGEVVRSGGKDLMEAWKRPQGRD